jgi:hypothetical protein
MGIVIQPRDRAILQTVYEQHFVLMRDAERYFFPGVSVRKAQQRIVELERAGLVRRERLKPYGHQPYLRLTKDGRSVATADRAVEIPQIKNINVTTFQHDRIVGAVRLRLREFWSATWIPEGALKKEDYPQIPDGMLLFPSGTRVAIEVENSIKGPKRFHELMKRWAPVPVKLVLYIATSPNLFNLLQGYLKKGPEGLPFGLLNWSDLEMRQPLVWTVRKELDLLSWREL